MPPQIRREVLVVGGGIGGLTAALALSRRGAWVRVLERSAQIAEIGAGLQITPNGAKVLRSLGLDPRSFGIPASAVEPHDLLTGRRIARFDLGRAAGDYSFVLRSDLIDVLRQAVEAAGVPIRTGAEVDGIVPEGVRLVGGETDHADLVIGADGIRSVVRRDLLGGPSAAFTGQIAWRAIVRHRQDPVARIWMGPGRHAVTYPLRDGRLNLVAVREESEWAEEGWSHADDPDAFRSAFGPVAGDLREILGKVERVGKWGLFVHPVPDRWHDGRNVLLGDAAHPTLPFLAQGANLAIEDAWVLAREAVATDLAEGLDRYQRDRHRRVCDAVEAAAQNARNYHLSGIRRRLAHAALRSAGLTAPGAFLRRFDWLYGFDATADG